LPLHVSALNIGLLKRPIHAILKDPVLVSTSFALGLTVGLSVSHISESCTPYRTAEDLPIISLRDHRPYTGKIISVTDGDTVRVQHLPLFSFLRPSVAGKKSDTTIQFRLLAYDSPETAKFGKPGQPFGEEAKSYLSNLIIGKRVSFRCYSRDQYGRVVGSITIGDFLGKRDISSEMVKEGFGSIYRGTGAQYGDHDLDWWTKLEARAQSERKGMWINGAQGVQLPSEFKRQMKE